MARFIHKELKKMRIVAGEFRSRVIRAVDGTGTRPTTDKVKEAIFSRIGPYFDGGVMLDLFGGSGNMSLEAISRGMEKSIINDKDGKAIRTIKENVKSLGVEKRCVIMKMDYHRVLEEMKSQKQSFDLVFLDPPYKKQQIHEILTLLDEYDLVNEQGDVVCESQKEDVFEDQIGCFEKRKDVTYGITRITYYKKRGTL
ncbi:16S rRNA (guanine(966)-N(2))-methyltransferase RsmD [[Eubacterium] hominis]|uniref:16S rRNA (guanine(966)-N(2))-methyltransferase RsmD n=1 Tax=[Eubacterium] hominis TaxID=2764325 RepID=UPI003A4D8A37